MVNEKYYILQVTMLARMILVKAIGSIMRNPPNETCKYQAQNFEASELKNRNRNYSTSNGTDIIAVV